MRNWNFADMRIDILYHLLRQRQVTLLAPPNFMKPCDRFLSRIKDIPFRQPCLAGHVRQFIPREFIKALCLADFQREILVRQIVYRRYKIVGRRYRCIASVGIDK